MQNFLPFCRLPSAFWMVSFAAEKFFVLMMSSLFMGFPAGTVGKETACQCRGHKKWKRQKRCRFDPCIGKIPWRKAWNPFQYSCLPNPMVRGPWRATVLWLHRVRYDWSKLACSLFVVAYASDAISRNYCLIQGIKDLLLCFLLEVYDFGFYI